MTWENGGLPSQRPPHFLLKPKVLKGIGWGEHISYSIILLAFGRLGPFHLSSLWCLRLYLFIFLAFGTLGVRTAPCTFLTNEDTPPALSVGGRGVCKTTMRQPGDAADFSLPLNFKHCTFTSRATGWSLPGHFWIPAQCALCAAHVQPAPLKWPVSPMLRLRLPNGTLALWNIIPEFTPTIQGCPTSQTWASYPDSVQPSKIGRQTIPTSVEILYWNVEASTVKVFFLHFLQADLRCNCLGYTIPNIELFSCVQILALLLDSCRILTSFTVHSQPYSRTSSIRRKRKDSKIH